MQLRWERVELKDGDFIDLAWHGDGNSGPLIIVLHGLEGSLSSHYATPLLDTLVRAGYRAVFMHLRGCSGEPNRLNRSYHSGATEDLSEVLEYLRNNAQAPQAAVGYSLGGNLLLKYLGEVGEETVLKAAIAVSVPFRLDQAVRRMEDGVSVLYGRYLLNRLKQTFNRRFRERPSPLPVDLSSIRTLYEYDEHITSKLNGFRDADDYYTRCSCLAYLKGIRPPTLILHAKDDPFMYPETPPADTDLGPGVKLMLTEHGGHVGFVAGRLPWRPVYWADQRILEFIGETLPL